MVLVHCPVGGDGDSESGSGQEDSQETVDPEEDAAQDVAAKLRKRAGLPELEADGLPSSVATKYLILVKVTRSKTTVPNYSL